MRTKTLLLFVFLLTGMAFSQQGGTGQITFNKITTALKSPDEKRMKLLLQSWGYENGNGVMFKKGSEYFQITWVARGTAYYVESRASKQRREEIKSQAIEAGLKVKPEQGANLVRMEGNGFSVVIMDDGSISIHILGK